LEPSGVVLVAILGGVLLLAGAGGFRLWWSGRAGLHRYDPIIREAAARHHVSPFLVKGVIMTESGFRPAARGDKGEMGLMQITRGAVTDWERETGQRCRCNGMLFDPRLNIEIGTWYIGKAVTAWSKHRDGEVLALAQYNAGAGKARDWAPADPRDGVELDRIRFASTREYIRRVIHHWQVFESEHAKSK